MLKFSLVEGILGLSAEKVNHKEEFIGSSIAEMLNDGSQERLERIPLILCRRHMQQDRLTFNLIDFIFHLKLEWQVVRNNSLKT